MMIAKLNHVTKSCINTNLDLGFSILWLRKRLVYEFKGTLHEIWSGTYVIFCTLRLRFNICSTPNFVQGPFNMILWLRKILFITRNIWGNKCMTYFKGPCTKFEVELMSFFIHFGCMCIETQIMERFLINNDDPSSIPENIEKYSL